MILTYFHQMSALAHLGANSSSPKQRPALLRHQNAITASAGGGPYPTINVSLVFGLERLYALTDLLSHVQKYWENAWQTGARN